MVAGLFACWIAVAPLLADALVVEHPIGQADAIVILSGAADYRQRARGGAAEFDRGVAPRIVLTNDDERGGWDDTEKGNPYFVDRSVAELKKHGVPAEAITILPGKVYGTNDEAGLVIANAVELGYRRIVIVTSDYHSRRALWTFDRATDRAGAGLTIGLVRSPSAPGYPGRFTWWLTPRGWRTVAAEYVKFAYYWLFY